MKVYAFDVDETLDIGPVPGPISLEDLKYLHNKGEIVGICGNYHVFLKFARDWHMYINFFGSLTGDKPSFLRAVKFGINTGNPAVTDFVMVGNRAGTGRFDSTNDDGSARVSGWRFISEQEFHDGKR